jgi:hypothetical protein
MVWMLNCYVKSVKKSRGGGFEKNRSSGYWSFKKACYATFYVHFNSCLLITVLIREKPF